MTIVFFILAFLITIAVHEAAHAYTADRLGDPTPKLMGRLTLNPLAHIDIYGTVIIPILLMIMGAPVIGWAKPVPIDPYNLANPKKDSALIAFAGPLANIILATILAIILRLTGGGISIASTAIYALITFNVTIAVFNLIPIHPLDGGKVLVGLLPKENAHEIDSFLSRFGYMILIFLIFPIFGGRSLVSAVISPIINIILNLLLP